MRTCLWAITISLVASAMPYSAASTYVIVNNDNPAGNSVSVYILDSGGILSPYKVIATGGAGGGSGDFAWTGQAVTQNASCGFVADTGSNDIAAFSEATGFARVGNYSNAALTFAAFGSGIAVAPNGKFLYGAYSGSGNIGAWAINKNCSLTFLAAYAPSMGTDIDLFLRVTPNDKYLLVAGEYLGRAESYSINQTTGALTDLGFLDFASTTNSCNGFECFPSGIDITADSKFAVFANAVPTPSALSVSIGTSGLSNAQVWPLAYDLAWAEVPFLSAAAYKGNGNLYFSMSGQSQTLPGVITTTFEESGGQITIKPYANTPIQNTELGLIAGIASSGDLMVVVEPSNQIDQYTIEDGLLFIVDSPTTDSQAYGLTSVSLFPNTR
jgi:hypothetical protein